MPRAICSSIFCAEILTVHRLKKIVGFPPEFRTVNQVSTSSNTNTKLNDN